MLSVIGLNLCSTMELRVAPQQSPRPATRRAGARQTSCPPHKYTSPHHQSTPLIPPPLLPHPHLLPTDSPLPIPLPHLPLTHPGHLPLPVNPPKPLHLLRQTTMAPLRPHPLNPRDTLPLELPIKPLHEFPPPFFRLPLLKMRQDPLPLGLNVRLDHLAEADSGVAADLLHGALVQRCDGGLIVPVQWRRVGEDAVTAGGVGQADQKFVFLIAGSVVGETLEATGHELGARVGLVNG